MNCYYLVAVARRNKSKALNSDVRISWKCSDDLIMREIISRGIAEKENVSSESNLHRCRSQELDRIIINEYLFSKVITYVVYNRND